MSEPPLYVEPLVGWRTWRLETAQNPPSPGGGQFQTSWLRKTAQPPEQPGDGQFLVSGLDTIWPPREKLTAVCRTSADHAAPSRDCGPPGCGIYAARSFSDLQEMHYAAGPHDTSAPDVVGEIWVWGRVFVSDVILRAEFAYPKRLILPWKHHQHAGTLEQTYGVIVELRNPFEMKEKPHGP